MRRLLCLTILVALFGAPRAWAGPPPDGPRVDYKPPVDVPITDHFRKPEHNWNSGNRGIDYATLPGTPVRAAADGEVTFAGQVGGTQHVVVLHADGLRTSYSFLVSVAVHRGDRVKQGDMVGTSGPSVHFGAREPDDTYIDPEQLFTGSAEVHLVPEHQRGARSEGDERAGIVKLLAAVGRGAAGATAATVEWAARRGIENATAPARLAIKAGAELRSGGDELRGAVHYAMALQGCLELLGVARGVSAWIDQRDNCTAADVPAPTLASRHRVVLVGGLGSAKGHAAVLDVPTARLGYAPNDVTQFSYRGGTTDDTPYGPWDTTVDIRRSGRRLRALLERMAQEEPGVPIDVIAHSQGGLVTRLALGNELDVGSRRRPPLGAVVTLGTPHQGADLATAVEMLGYTPSGTSLFNIVGKVAPGAPDTKSASVGQLSENSELVRGMQKRPVPADVRFTSIGARGDLVVPAPRTRVAGARNVAVSVPGAVHDHDGLPGSAAAEREVALAVNGMPPTCQTFTDAMTDTIVGTHLGLAEDALGAALWASARTMPSLSPRRS